MFNFKLEIPTYKNWKAYAEQVQKFLKIFGMIFGLIILKTTANRRRTNARKSQNTLE